MSGAKSRYIPALDGLRAFAVLAVIAYHMHFSWASGGLLGVTIFFVLSGYLITSLLLIEFDNTGKIDLPQFWLRRIRRLVPAIIFVIVVTVVLCTIFNHVLLTKMRPDVIPSLFFFNNWWQIFHDVSYFEALGAPSPLAHFWSLAIEEQFYLIWPVVLFVCMKVGVKRTAMRNATLVLIALSALEMALLFNPTADPSRVYYGTDTRAFSLLIGAWLAFVWPSHMLGAKKSVRLSKQVRRVLDGVGIVAVVGLVLMITFTNGFDPFLYRGGLVLCSVLTAIAIAVMVHPASLLGRAAGAAPLVWLGKRSYGIYLWHYPLLLLMSPPPGSDQPWWMYPLQLLVILALSAFSYRFVENPIRHGAIGVWVKNIKSGVLDISDWLRTRIIPAAGSVILVAVAVGGLVFVPPTSAIEGGDLLKQQTEEQQAQQAQAIVDQAKQAAQPKLDILLIGDSVSVRSVPYFKEAFPYGAIDSLVSRQLYAGKEIYNFYRNQDIVGDLVVFSLGTNGPVDDQQLDDLIADVGSEKQIWFINTRHPEGWEQLTNEAIASASARHANVHVIDWFAYSEGKEWLFDGDGTHLTEEAAQIYVDLIHEAVASYLPEHSEGDEVATVKSSMEIAFESAQEATTAMTKAMTHNVLSPLNPDAPPAKQPAS